ncbi:MAG: transcription antitermination factor NusB [Kiritimatiellia bacterium]
MRREAREFALQFLFEIEFEHSDIQETLKDFWSLQESPPSKLCQEFTELLIWGVLENLEPIDAALRKVAENWDVKRMSKVDRNILRIAIYEMRFRTDIPPVVSINEAVDIARDYSGGISGKFVNGILDRISKDLDRPLRTAKDEPPKKGDA